MSNHSSRTEHLLALQKKGDDSYNRQDFDAMIPGWHPDFVANIAGNPEPLRGTEAHAAAIATMYKAFPDIHLHNDPYRIQFGSGDWITVLTRTTGTFTGEMTLPDGTAVPPTGKKFDLDTAIVIRYEGDLAIEEYVLFDTTLMAQQIGLA